MSSRQVLLCKKQEKRCSHQKPKNSSSDIFFHGNIRTYFVQSRDIPNNDGNYQNVKKARVLGFWVVYNVYFTILCAAFVGLIWNEINLSWIIVADDHIVIFLFWNFAKSAHQLLKWWMMVQFALHGKVTERLPWRLISLNFHWVRLHGALVPHGTWGYHWNTLHRSMQSAAILKVEIWYPWNNNR